jgi:hypothetical protein
MKNIFIALMIFSTIWAVGPQGATYTPNGEAFEEQISHSKPPQWIRAPLPDSFEARILPLLAQEERWTKLKNWRPLPIGEYRAILTRHRLAVSHQEIHRLILKDADIREWLRTELAPKLGLDPVETTLFIEDFLAYLPLYRGVYKELLIQVSSIEKS